MLLGTGPAHAAAVCLCLTALSSWHDRSAIIETFSVISGDGHRPHKSQILQGRDNPATIASSIWQRPILVNSTVLFFVFVSVAFCIRKLRPFRWSWDTAGSVDDLSDTGCYPQAVRFESDERSFLEFNTAKNHACNAELGRTAHSFNDTQVASESSGRDSSGSTHSSTCNLKPEPEMHTTRTSFQERLLGNSVADRFRQVKQCKVKLRKIGSCASGSVRRAQSSIIDKDTNNSLLKTSVAGDTSKPANTSWCSGGSGEQNQNSSATPSLRRDIALDLNLKLDTSQAPNVPKRAGGVFRNQHGPLEPDVIANDASTSSYEGLEGKALDDEATSASSAPVGLMSTSMPATSPESTCPSADEPADASMRHGHVGTDVKGISFTPGMSTGSTATMEVSSRSSRGWCKSRSLSGDLSKAPAQMRRVTTPAVQASSLCQHEHRPAAQAAGISMTVTSPELTCHSEEAPVEASADNAIHVGTDSDDGSLTPGVSMRLAPTDEVALTSVCGWCKSRSSSGNLSKAQTQAGQVVGTEVEAHSLCQHEFRGAAHVACVSTAASDSRLTHNSSETPVEAFADHGGLVAADVDDINATPSTSTRVPQTSEVASRRVTGWCKSSNLLGDASKAQAQTRQDTTVEVEYFSPRQQGLRPVAHAAAVSMAATSPESMCISAKAPVNGGTDVAEVNFASCMSRRLRPAGEVAPRSASGWCKSRSSSGDPSKAKGQKHQVSTADGGDTSPCQHDHRAVARAAGISMPISPQSSCNFAETSIAASERHRHVGVELDGRSFAPSTSTMFPPSNEIVQRRASGWCKLRSSSCDPSNAQGQKHKVVTTEAGDISLCQYRPMACGTDPEKGVVVSSTSSKSTRLYPLSSSCTIPATDKAFAAPVSQRQLGAESEVADEPHLSHRRGSATAQSNTQQATANMDGATVRPSHLVEDSQASVLSPAASTRDRTQASHGGEESKDTWEVIYPDKLPLYRNLRTGDCVRNLSDLPVGARFASAADSHRTERKARVDSSRSKWTGARPTLAPDSPDASRRLQSGVSLSSAGNRSGGPFAEQSSAQTDSSNPSSPVRQHRRVSAAGGVPPSQSPTQPPSPVARVVGSPSSFRKPCPSGSSFSTGCVRSAKQVRTSAALAAKRQPGPNTFAVKRCELVQELSAMIKEPIELRKKAFRSLQLEWHPDKNPTAYATDIFKLLEEKKAWFLQERPSRGGNARVLS